MRPESRRIISRLRLTMFLVSLPFGMLMFMLPIMGREMGATALEIGGLYSVFSLMTVVLRPLIGGLLDRVGRRPFLLAGVACYALANLLFALRGGVAGLYGARIAQGIGAGMTWLSAYAMVADMAEAEDRGGNFGQVDEMATRGGLVGAFVAFGLMGLLGDEAGWRMSFVLFTLIGLGALVLAGFSIPETRRNVSVGDAVGDPVRGGSFFKDTRTLLSGPFVTLMGIVLITGTAYALTSPILMLYLHDHVTDDIALLAMAFFPSALIYALLPSRFGRLSDRVGRRPPMALALLVGGVVSMMIPRLRSLWPLVGLWIAESASFAAAMPAEEALVADLSPPAMRGLAYGVYTGTYSLGSVVGPLLGGWLYDALGEHVPFYANGALLWVGALCVALLLQVPKPVSSVVGPPEA